MMMTPPPQYVQQPPTAVPPPRFPSGPANPAPAPPPRLARGVMADPKPTPLQLVATDPPPAPLMMPSPEQLGIGAAAKPTAPPAPLDWDNVHRRLDRLGIICFHLEKLTPDACRVVCLVPTADAARQQRIEATGASQAEAVQRALLRAEEWAVQRR